MDDPNLGALGLASMMPDEPDPFAGLRVTCELAVDSARAVVLL